MRPLFNLGNCPFQGMPGVIPTLLRNIEKGQKALNQWDYCRRNQAALASVLCNGEVMLHGSQIILLVTDAGQLHMQLCH
jgi:hypothetical protein